jgi:hypothetical protein
MRFHATVDAAFITLDDFLLEPGWDVPPVHSRVRIIRCHINPQPNAIKLNRAAVFGGVGCSAGLGANAHGSSWV